MDEEAIENPLIPFYTIRSSGTGLGMPIAQKIIEGHKGGIHIARQARTRDGNKDRDSPAAEEGGIMKFLIPGIFLLFIPSNALAFVPHAYEEVYIHQMGHIFFIISCVFIMWVIWHHNLQDKKGWRYIFLSEIFFILWNVDTFVGHITEYWIEPSQMIGAREGWDYFFRRISIEGREYLYYINEIRPFSDHPRDVLFCQRIVGAFGRGEKDFNRRVVAFVPYHGIRHGRRLYHDSPLHYVP